MYFSNFLRTLRGPALSGLVAFAVFGIDVTLLPVAENPLPLCPGTPNCVRKTRVFPGAAPEVLFADARTALEAIGPSEVHARDSAYHLDAVFRVFFFKDDVQLAVTSHAEGAALHVRSASRVGRHDLGVNARRVRRFFRRLEEQRC